MWRMLLRPADFPTEIPGAAMALTRADEAEIDALFAGHPDRPDTYDPRQVRDGVFYGVRRGGRLVSVAGTHVIGPATGVAALGNVFTHPDHRRRGYGRTASAAVTSALLERRIQTIVLNVTMDNEPALDLYRGLGFMPFCGYYEGVGALAAA
jgi:ribosomal protein S18 acetylase RimI-like enzyme